MQWTSCADREYWTSPCHSVLMWRAVLNYKLTLLSGRSLQFPPILRNFSEIKPQLKFLDVKELDSRASKTWTRTAVQRIKREFYHLFVCASCMLLLQSLHKVNSIEIICGWHTCGHSQHLESSWSFFFRVSTKSTVKRLSVVGIPVGTANI